VSFPFLFSAAISLRRSTSSFSLPILFLLPLVRKPPSSSVVSRQIFSKSSALNLLPVPPNSRFVPTLYLPRLLIFLRPSLISVLGADCFNLFGYPPPPAEIAFARFLRESFSSLLTSNVYVPRPSYWYNGALLSSTRVTQ